MSKKVICKSEKGESITFEHNFPYFLISIDGIHNMLADINSSEGAFSIGEKYNGTSIKKRNIIIKGAFRCSKFEDVIRSREKLYRTFPLKTQGTLYYYEKDLARKINYYVESLEIEEVGVHRKFQISLICPYPYFMDIDIKKESMATWSPAFKFALKIPESTGIKFGTKNVTSMANIVNKSNIEYGMKITFKANDYVVNPSLFDVATRKEIKIEKVMKAGDKIIVTTQKQDKNIIFISSSTGIEENINNLMVYGSKFLQIYPGANTYRYNADEGVDNLEAVIEYITEYEAI